MKSVEELLKQLSKFNECVIPIKDKNWSDKFQRVENALVKQKLEWKVSTTDELDVWVYLIK